jgi:hypothetical protein
MSKYAFVFCCFLFYAAVISVLRDRKIRSPTVHPSKQERSLCAPSPSIPLSTFSKVLNYLSHPSVILIHSNGRVHYSICNVKSYHLEDFQHYRKKSSECVLPPHERRGRGGTHSPGGEGVGGQYFGRYQTLDWPLTG